MKAAKIITFIAFVLNSFFTLSSVFTFLEIRPVFQELEVKTQFPWPIFILFAFAILNLIYWFYLKNKEREGKTVKFALWISIALLLIPWLFFYSLTIISMLQPIYNLMKALE